MSRKNRVLIFVICCVLFVVSCKRQQQGEQTVLGHRIHLEKDTIDTGLVSCYADSQKLVFNDDLLDGGGVAMLLHQSGRYAYVVGDLVPNSNGWTVRYHLYRVDTQTLETKHIGDFAAIHFEKDGIKAATARLTNPDANCTADEVWVMQDNYYDNEGTLLRKGENEYGYDKMVKEYSDSLVNADGFRYNTEYESSYYETGMRIYQKGGHVYMIDDIMPNGNGWTVRFQLYRADTLTNEDSHIGDFAAIHFEDSGFKAATARLVNPDAQCTADEEWVLHDEYYSYDGTLLRKDPREYHYYGMQKIYGDSLVNAPIYRSILK